MNRRVLLSLLGGAMTVPVAARSRREPAASVQEPERCLSFVHPACPRCGSAAMFLRPSEFVGDLVPDECAGYGGGCGWKGVSPVAR